MNKTETAFVFGDVHGIYYDPKCFDIIKQLIKDIKPQRIYINGDLIDFYGISKFDKDPDRHFNLQDEIDQAVYLLRDIKAVSKEAKIHFVEGNHESRLRKYLWSKASELSSLRSLKIESLLMFDELGIEYHRSKGKSAYAELGKIKIGHFDVALSNSAASEKKLVLKYADTIIQGHTHRLGKFYKSFGSEEKMVVGVGSGCCCMLDPEYCSDPDWHHGAVVINKIIGVNRYHIQDIPIIKHETLFNGKLYRSKI